MNLPRGRPAVIVIGNEKGGTGKSTTAMHLIAAMLRQGGAVGAIDLDARQGTLTRYLQNRASTAERMSFELPHPVLKSIKPSEHAHAVEAEADERERLASALAQLKHLDFVVIDTPGSDSRLSRLGHSYADVLITPMNDSFVDLDLLAAVDPDTFQVLQPSKYAEMVWDQKKRRAMRDRGVIEWIVTRNRLASIESRNRRNMDRVLGEMARRFGFRLLPGFGERVIFRELFLKGLTLLDLGEGGSEVKFTMSHLAARQEVRNLLGAIGLKDRSRVGRDPASPSRLELFPAGIK